MTSHPIQVRPDGTRVYKGGKTYKPKAPEDRVYASRKPSDPRAVRFHGAWFLPLQLAEELNRVMPETREDAETLTHAVSCVCEVCLRPQARRYWRKARRSRFTGDAPGHPGARDGSDHDR